MAQTQLTPDQILEQIRAQAAQADAGLNVEEAAPAHLLAASTPTTGTTVPQNGQSNFGALASGLGNMAHNKNTQKELSSAAIGGGIGTAAGWGLGALLAPETAGLSLVPAAIGSLIGGGLGLWGGSKHKSGSSSAPAAQTPAQQSAGIADTGQALTGMVQSQMAGLAPYIQDMISSQNATSTLEQQAVAHLPPGLQGIYNAANVMQANTVRQLADSFAVQQTSLPYQQFLASIPVKFNNISGLSGILPSATVNQNTTTAAAADGLPVPTQTTPTTIP